MENCHTKDSMSLVHNFNSGVLDTGNGQAPDRAASVAMSSLLGVTMCCCLSKGAHSICRPQGHEVCFTLSKVCLSVVKLFPLCNSEPLPDMSCQQGVESPSVRPMLCNSGSPCPAESFCPSRISAQASATCSAVGFQGRDASLWVI